MLTRLNKRSDRAFTLTEVIVGICLLTIVWLAAVNVIVVSRGSGSLARHKSQAVYLIQQKIENLRKSAYSALANGTTTPCYLRIDANGTLVVSSTIYDADQKMTLTISTPNTYYKKILITMAWKESFFGKQKTVREFGGTYIANDSQAN